MDYKNFLNLAFITVAHEYNTRHEDQIKETNLHIFNEEVSPETMYEQFGYYQVTIALNKEFNSDLRYEVFYSDEMDETLDVTILKVLEDIHYEVE